VLHSKRIRSLDTLRQALTRSQEIESRDTKEYLQRIVNRNILQEMIYKAMADNRVDALAYPTIRRKAKLIGEPQLDDNCRLSFQSGLPAITVPGGFTPDGLPVGLELLGRAWSEPQLIRVAYAYEQAAHHRQPGSIKRLGADAPDQAPAGRVDQAPRGRTNPQPSHGMENRLSCAAGRRQPVVNSP
jgi:amidase